MPEVILYEFDVSPFCEKVRRVLHLKGVAYETREMLAVMPWELRRINPRGKFPTLEWDGERVYDSTDIARFVEEKVPEPRLFPEHPGQAAFSDLLEDWADESLVWFEMALRFGRDDNARRIGRSMARHLPAPLRPAFPALLQRLQRHNLSAQGMGRKPMDVIERELDGHYAMLGEFLRDRPFLTGDAIAIADVAVSAQVWALLDSGQRPSLERHPALASWYDRVTEATAPPHAG